MTAARQLAPDLYLHQGATNTGILRAGRQALLIDCGADDVDETLAELGIEHVARIVFTHYHRDQASAAYAYAAAGAAIGVPAAELSLFAHVEGFWADPAHRWHLYDMRPQTLTLCRSLPVHETYAGGQTITWGAFTICVIETPGHTDGSVSYLVLAPGNRLRRTVLFCGDVIYGEGQLWDLYSLQHGTETRDYHGFMGARGELASSLAAMLAADAEVWVPSHGDLIAAPARAAQQLTVRLSACYDAYASISALRHYFPDLFAGQSALPGAMPISEGLQPPAYLRHIGTSWVVSSADGAAFVIDCGSAVVVDALRRMQDEGSLGPVEWLWLSHYHDDHVDAIPSLIEAFGCPVVADGHVAQVVENPSAWRLPCISPVRVSVNRRTRHGERWQWHEFTITAYHLPGQTLYHGGLLVEGRGQRLFFVGDSFTMAGIDDYCPGNRNHLRAGAGFDACITLLEALEPDFLLNCHVDLGFRFSPAQLHSMRRNLARRVDLYGQIVPWDDPNYGLDEHWVRCHPYAQTVVPGGAARFEVIITNHSAVDHSATCEPVLPTGWGAHPGRGTTLALARAEASIAFRIAVPKSADPGLYVVPIRVRYADRDLGQWREAIVRVVGSPRATRDDLCT